MNGRLTWVAAVLVLACGGSRGGAAVAQPPRGGVGDGALVQGTRSGADAGPPADPDGLDDAQRPATAGDPEDGGTSGVAGADATGAATEETHCILLTLRAPRDRAAQQVEALLSAEGFAIGREGPDVALTLTEAQIASLFGARIEWRVTGASARPTLVREPFLRGGRVPVRLRRYVSSFALGYQICE